VYKHLITRTTCALALGLASIASPALDYSGRQQNQATFESLAEARVNGPLAVAKLDGNAGKTFLSHPAMDGYPDGTTWIYRSPNDLPAIIKDAYYNLYGMPKIASFDFDRYPLDGFRADAMDRIGRNDEYDSHRWYINNAGGVPMVALSYTQGLMHALYPEYGKIAWEFFRHYSRDGKSGAIAYKP
jgi:hypothetical protein